MKVLCRTKSILLSTNTSPFIFVLILIPFFAGRRHTIRFRFGQTTESISLVNMKPIVLFSALSALLAQVSANPLFFPSQGSDSVKPTYGAPKPTYGAPLPVPSYKPSYEPPSQDFDFKLPKFELPKIPKPQLPSLKLPNIPKPKLPSLKLPSLPKLELSNVNDDK